MRELFLLGETKSAAVRARRAIGETSDIVPHFKLQLRSAEVVEPRSRRPLGFDPRCPPAAMLFAD